MIFGQLFRVMKARLGLILMIVAVTLATAAAASFLMTKRYVATASMVVNIPSSDPINGGATYLPGTVAGLLATQVDLIKSDRVAQKVVDLLGLTMDPKLVQEFKAGGGLGDMRRWLSTKLLQELTVEAARESAFITLSYESKDPEFAAKATNAFADAYIEATLEMKTEPAKNYASMFEAQAKQYRSELAKAQEKLVQFQQQSGIMTSDERMDVENIRLQELSTQLVQIQGVASESRSRENAVQRSGRDAMPEVTANGVIQNLKAELVRAETRYHDQAGQLGSNHPTIIAINADIASLRARIESETARLTNGIAATSSINRQRASELQSAFEAQRAKVMQIRRQRDQLALLQRDVDAAQRAYDLLTQRLTQTNLEGSARLSNVSVASGAAVPTTPSRPQPVLNMALGAIFGLFLGLLAAMTVEGFQRPLRTSEDLLHAAGVPVLAVLPPATSRRPQRLIGNTGPSVGPSLRLTNN